MSEISEQEIPVSLPYGVKLESTAKGYRIHISGHSIDGMLAIANAVEMLKETEKRLKDAGYTIAPVVQ